VARRHRRPGAAPFPRTAQADYHPDEARDSGGKWTGDGGLNPRGPETPIPPGIAANAILAKWVQQGGSGRLTPVERDTLTATVNTYGKQPPAGLTRGESNHAPAWYKTGKTLKLAPASFTTEEESALPYAEAGDHPTVLHLDNTRGVKGLNVSALAQAEGFNEQEWVLAGRFTITGSETDSEGGLHVDIAYAGAVEAAVAVEVKGRFDPDERRDDHGRWGDGGGPARNPSGRLAVQVPSHFVHPGTGHLMGQTETGDTFEALFAAKGAHLLAAKYPGAYEPISGLAKRGGGRGARNTPLDFRLDHLFGGELKTMNTAAGSNKTGIKAAQVARKEDAARDLGVAPLLVVQVVDQAKGAVQVYAWPGFVSKTATAMHHLGSYTFSRADFRAAQQATGHWAQRAERARRQAQAAGLPPDPPAEEPDLAPGDTVIELRDGVPWIGTQPGGSAQAAFNPDQPRDKEGRWLADALKHMPARTQISHRGHTIDSTANKGFRVRLKSGEVRHYQRPEDAAKAAREGKHHDPGTPPKARGLVGWKPDELARLDGLAAPRGLSGGAKGDEALAAIAAAQGFDGPPEHGSIADTVAAGGVAVYRGLQDPGGQAPAWAKAYTDGTDRRQGLGLTGNGNYFTADRGIAEEYAGTSTKLDPAERGPGAVISGALKPGARIVPFEQLEREWSAYQFDPARKGAPGEAATTDISRYAAMRGDIDAVLLNYLGAAYVVLNRTALVVEP
jgi:hypothetical protein